MTKENESKSPTLEELDVTELDLDAPIIIPVLYQCGGAKHQVIVEIKSQRDIMAGGHDADLLNQQTKGAGTQLTNMVHESRGAFFDAVAVNVLAGIKGVNNTVKGWKKLVPYPVKIAVAATQEVATALERPILSESEGNA